MKAIDVERTGPETEPLPSRTAAIAVARGVDTTTPEWRERFGRAAYDAYKRGSSEWMRPWDKLQLRTRERWARVAAASLVEAAKPARDSTPPPSNRGSR